MPGVPSCQRNSQIDNFEQLQLHLPCCAVCCANENKKIQQRNETSLNRAKQNKTKQENDRDTRRDLQLTHHCLLHLSYERRCLPKLQALVLDLLHLYLMPVKKQKI